MTGPVTGPELPRLRLLTDRTQCRGSLLDAVEEAVETGARAVVLREKDLPRPEREELTDRIGSLLRPVHGVLIVAGGGAGGSSGGATHGVHLAANDAFPAPRPGLVGRSCHCADEVARARREGCDYVTVSPVFPTSSKPGYGPPIGLDGLRRLVENAPAAYALGGVRPLDAPLALAAGAHGLAVMGALMRQPSRTATYLQRLQDAFA